MIIKNIDKYFTLEILHRGYKYYKDNHVIDIKKKRGIWYAKVLGSELYDTSVKINKNSITMRCSCPYSYEDNCKHMAALLYCLKKDKLDYKEDIYIPESVDNINQFKKIYGKRYYKLLDRKRILNNYDLYIYTKLIYSFTKDSDYYIKNNPTLGYKIFEYLMLNVNEIRTNSSKEFIYNSIYNSYNKLFINDDIFNELIIFIKMLYMDEYVYNDREYILELIYNDIDNKYKAEQYIKLLNNLIKRKIYTIDKKKLKYKIIKLKYNYINKEHAIKEAYNNLDNKYICYYLLDIYKSDNNKKIELLENIISNNNIKDDDVFYCLLSDLYSKDRDKYLDILYRYLSKYNSLYVYDLIKSLYSKKDWINERYKYIKVITNNNMLIDIYMSEKLYNEALVLLKDKDIYCVSHFINDFKNNKDILDIYYDKLIEEIDKSSTRDDYKKLIEYYDILLNVSNGKNILIKLFNYIKDNYKNRLTLIDEISFYEDTYL